MEAGTHVPCNGIILEVIVSWISWITVCLETLRGLRWDCGTLLVSPCVASSSMGLTG